MLIRNEQVEAFKLESLRNFEGEMVEHIREYFPNHYKIIGEERVRDVVRYGYHQAVGYEFTTQRNVCLYLNQMFILGSNFDKDPQIPWTSEMLTSTDRSDASSRIDALADKASVYFHEIAGPDQQYLNRLLVKFHRQSREFFAKPITGNFEAEMLDRLKAFWPKKFDSVGASNLQSMITLGKEVAGAYGITHKNNLFMYLTFMFLLGSRFDTDPQFYWAEDILKDNSIPDQESRIDRLYDLIMKHLESFLAKE